MAKRLGAEVREQAAQGAGPPGCPLSCGSREPAARRHVEARSGNLACFLEPCRATSRLELGDGVGRWRRIDAMDSSPVQDMGD